VATALETNHKVLTGAAPEQTDATLGIRVQPLGQAASLQRSGKTHWACQSLRCVPLRRHCRALSHRNYSQLSAGEPGLGFARTLWRIKELRTGQSLHDLPPIVGG